MSQELTVQDGDCAVSLAEEHGFRNYRVVWDDAANEELRSSRPNPNMLIPGDVLKLPEPQARAASAATDRTTTFTVSSKKRPRLRILLVDAREQPLKGLEWTLLGAEGTTGGDGLIELDALDPKVKSAELKVTRPAGPESKPAPVTPPGGGAPAYPPRIDPTEFKDAAPPDAKPVAEVTWSLRIGSLPSPNHDTGVQARLANLGFACDVGAEAAATERAVKAYQRWALADENPSGKLADIQGDLRTRHDGDP